MFNQGHALAWLSGLHRLACAPAPARSWGFFLNARRFEVLAEAGLALSSARAGTVGCCVVVEYE